MYSQNQNIWRPNNLNVFVSKKSKDPKHDIQNRLWAPMPGEENLCFNDNML